MSSVAIATVIAVCSMLASIIVALINLFKYFRERREDQYKKDAVVVESAEVAVRLMQDLLEHARQSERETHQALIQARKRIAILEARIEQANQRIGALEERRQ